MVLSPCRDDFTRLASVFTAQEQALSPAPDSAFCNQSWDGLVISSYPFCCELLQGEAGKSLESPDQKTRGFLN
jgi:hypothetical protein